MTENGDKSEEREDTLITCKACGGDYDRLYANASMYSCRWCFNGSMSKEQLITWLQYCKTRKESGRIYISEIEKIPKSK